VRGLVLVATCSAKNRSARAAIVGVFFSAVRMAAGSVPPAEPGSCFARLLGRQGAVATYRDTLGP
jgi:hypothetical protein